MADGFLYTFNAKGVTSKSKNNGNIRLSFKEDGVSSVSSFSQRPERDVSYMTIKSFADQFDKGFSSSKPNASLNFWVDGESQIVNHVIKKMSVNSKNSKVTMIVEPQAISGSIEEFPGKIDETSFFVDSGTFKGNNNCFSFFGCGVTIG